MQVFRTTERNFAVRRALPAVGLTLAALGLGYLPGRQLVSDPACRAASIQVQNGERTDNSRGISGQNSLFGDASPGEATSANVSEVAQYHLEVAGVFDQAGHLSLLDSIAPSASEMASASGSSAGADAPSVPEGSTGLVMVAVAPLLVARRPRKN